MRENKNGLGVMGYTIQCICFTDMKQAVRVATQYAPPLSSPPVGAPAPRAPPRRRNVAVVSHAQYVLTVTAAPASRVKAAVSKAAW